ncbi:concanavalin A-like lectin/glucanase domain-containing protein [Penicillium atrosanguineum]|nr:concanavalin A-like lectin/glucanase domain-containing protein [Penicillium atrosanguineum]
MALSPLRNLFPTIIFGEKTLQPPEASAHIWTPILWTQFPGKHRGHGKAAILVKSYANAALDIEATALNSITSLLQIGLERYTGNGNYGDVSYDAFLLFIRGEHNWIS